MQTDLNQHMRELVEQLPQIGDMASAKVALGGQAMPLWGQPVGPSGPKASCHVHLPPMCVFVTILAKIPTYKYISMYKGNLVNYKANPTHVMMIFLTLSCFWVKY
jgi:hypothetical protein